MLGFQWHKDPVVFTIPAAPLYTAAMPDLKEPASSSPTATALWQLAFRPGFLAAASCAVLAMIAWLALLEGKLAWAHAYSPSWWHAHEMLFGFAMPVVVGFVLTAVATWTGVPGTTGRRLQLLFACWLLGRISLPSPLPHALAIAAAADTLFMLGACWEVGRRVWSVRQKRNYAFVPIFIMFALFNLLSYRAAEFPLVAADIHYGVLWLFLLLIAFVGGRVIPFFTSRRLGFEQVPILPWLDFGSIFALLLIAMLSVSGQLLRDDIWIRGLLLLTAVMHFARLLRWRGWQGLGMPLLWSLHLSYLFIPLGLAGLAITVPDPVTSKHIMHLLGIGAMGGIILAMISRVALGHTGRPLEPHPAVSTSFALLSLAALLRCFLPLIWPELSIWGWRVSALLWISAFGVFLAFYTPILLTPRPDGKPG